MAPVGSPGSVGAPRPSYSRMLLRGAARRCPRCGAGKLFRGYFHLRERCPRCGYRFDREEGFFTGVLLVNLAVTEGLLFLAMMALIVVLSRDAHTNIVPIVAVGAVFAVGAPIVFYPFARTIWAALDLAMRPLSPVEEAEAALSAAPAPSRTECEQ